MRQTDRGYKIPEDTDLLEQSLPMFQETLELINVEQNQNDNLFRRIKLNKILEDDLFLISVKPSGDEIITDLQFDGGTF